MNAPVPGVDRRKVRIGLAIIGLLLIGCLAAAAFVEDTTGKIVFLAVAAVSLVRMALLARSVRKGTRTPVGN